MKFKFLKFFYFSLNNFFLTQFDYFSGPLSFGIYYFQFLFFLQTNIYVSFNVVDVVVVVVVVVVVPFVVRIIITFGREPGDIETNIVAKNNKQGKQKKKFAHPKNPVTFHRGNEKKHPNKILGI